MSGPGSAPNSKISWARPIRRALQRLARDRRSGSGELARRAVALLEDFHFPGASRDSKETPAVCVRLAHAVAQAQPSMAAVLNVCNRWLLAVEQGESPREAARAVARQLRQGQHLAALRAATLVEDGAAVVTYSFSSTVLAALLASWNRGRRFRVLCSEARPQMEGRLLAERLARQQVPVEFFTDAALFSSFAAGSLVLVGCDALESRTFVNKVGTRALLSLARRSRLSFYVVADPFKFLPAKLRRWFRIRRERAVEVWRPPRKNVLVHNLYFEKVPLRSVTAIVTDTGAWAPERIRDFLGNVAIARGFEGKPASSA